MFSLYPPEPVANVPSYLVYYQKNSERPIIIEEDDIKSCLWFINDIEVKNESISDNLEKKQSFIQKIFKSSQSSKHHGVLNRFIPLPEYVNLKLKVRAEIKNIKGGPKGENVELEAKDVIKTHIKRVLYHFDKPKEDENTLSNSFGLISYNIMADCYTQAPRYKTPPYALYRPYRKYLMDKYILDYDGDIICLQEYEPNFKELLESLKEKGFLNTPLVTSNYSNDNKPRYQPPDQCITFYRESRYTLIEEKVIDYNIINSSEYQLLEKEQIEQLQNNPVTKYYLEQVLKTLHHNRFSFLNLKDNSSNQEILVINVHLYWGAPNLDLNYGLQVIQVYILTLIIKNFKQKNPNNIHTPIILCGDLNNEPHHPANTFLRDGVYNMSHETEIFTFKHNLKFISTYGAHPYGEPSFTTTTKSFEKCIDFIYLNNPNSNLKIKSILEIGNNYKDTLPSIVEPSDHILIKTNFQWKGLEEEFQVERYEKGVSEDIEKKYKAAGILPFSKDNEGKLRFLMCCENKSHRNTLSNSKENLNNDKIFLASGGKLEIGENSIQTAIREFNEETSHLFIDKIEQFKVKIQDFPKFFNNRTNFLLYLMEIDYDDKISESYQSIDKSTFKNNPAVSIEWVDGDQVLMANETKTSFKRENGELSEFANFFSEMAPKIALYFNEGKN